MLQWPLRARKIVQAPEQFRSLFEEGNEFAAFRVAVGLPADAQMVMAYLDQPQTGPIVYVFTHPSWELVYSLVECPYQEVQYTTLGRALRWPLRARKVICRPDVFALLFGQGEQIAVSEVIEGLPDGAELENTYFDSARGQVMFVFSHPSWEEAGSLAQCPEQPITVAGGGHA